jgi:hypothetical protein
MNICRGKETNVFGCHSIFTNTKYSDPKDVPLSEIFMFNMERVKYCAAKHITTHLNNCHAEP